MRLLRNLFYLHKSDRNTLLALLATAAALLCLVYWAGGQSYDTDPEDDDRRAATTLTSAQHGQHGGMPPDRPRHGYYQTEARRPERFSFDPNTADSTQLLRLGLQPFQVQNIYRYRAKGGIFRTKDDFARLYGLTQKQYRELEPYIDISDDYLPASRLVEERHNGTWDDADSTEHAHHAKLMPGETIDLNTADTTLLQRVPGIGSYYARRIVDYRERLGGYVDIGQLTEIEGMPQTALPFLSLSEPQPRLLNINSMTINQLKQHPYINFYQARAIVDYRRQHGPLSSLDELRLLPDFPKEALERLKPYADFSR